MKSILYFSAEWCGPCRMYFPIIEEVCPALSVPYNKIDVDKNPELTQQYNITGVPTLIVLQDGEPIYRSTGVMPKSQLISTLEKLHKL